MAAVNPEPPRFRCLLLVPSNDEYISLRRALKGTAKELGVRLSSPDDEQQFSPLPRSETSETMTKADLVLAEISKPQPRIVYEVGLAHALGKPTFFLIEEGREEPLAFGGGSLLRYKNTTEGLTDLKLRFGKLLRDFIRAPRKYSAFLPTAARLAMPPIDLEKLEPREYENFCFELLTQMGFRRVEWGKELREFDAVAMLRKKDPDGFEYEETWLISMGLNSPVDLALEIAMVEPERFLDRLLRRPESRERFGSVLKTDTPITLLFIMIRRFGSERLAQEIRMMEHRLREPVARTKIRIRIWDEQQLTSLAEQYPQIIYKYFSEERRSQSKYRKTPEELYGENVQLTERLQLTLKALEEEKDKRVRAERDAVWKELSYTAAHKLGNPVFAIETNLEGIKKRIQVGADDALLLASEMEVSVEKAKSIIQQFKSLTKAQQISPQATKLVPLVENACMVAKENGVALSFETEANMPDAMVDAGRIAECLDELVANAMHWFDKPEKTIVVATTRVGKKDVPEGLDSSKRYLKVSFADNGCGVIQGNKKRIFDPFFTTFPHGTGLGLALVQRVILGHKGLIREVGIPGEGATFEVFLPAVESV